MRSDAIPRRNQPRLGSVLKLLVGTKVVYFRLAMWGISGDLCTVCAATRRDAPSQTASGLVPFSRALVARASHADAPGRRSRSG